jgi:undecaprenyl diphosphate synthase
MDGNGRWAQGRGHHRSFGHLRGAKTAKHIIEASAQLGIQYLTLYTFSTENWFRPSDEVSFLMKLLHRFLLREADTLMRNNIRFNCIGDIDRLPSFAKAAVVDCVEKSKNNTGMTLIFALNYGGRQEIVRAVRQLVEDAVDGQLSPSDISEAKIHQYLDTALIPDPDLVIRTSGEYRISNFMLWQMAYSELYFTAKLWPDFSKKDLLEALAFYAKRERRFGRTTSQSLPTQNEISMMRRH